MARPGSLLSSRRAPWTAVGAAALLAVPVACGGDDDGDASTSTAPSSVVTSVTTSAGTATSAGSSPTTSGTAAGRCLVRLHGKGGGGGPTTTSGDVTELAPTGNADGWGGRQWLYFPDDEYAAAAAIVQDAASGCG